MSIRTKSCACGYSSTAKQRFAPSSPKRRGRLQEPRPDRYPPHHRAAFERQRGPGLVPGHTAAEVRASLKAGRNRDRRRGLLFANDRAAAPAFPWPAVARAGADSVAAYDGQASRPALRRRLFRHGEASVWRAGARTSARSSERERCAEIARRSHCSVGRRVGGFEPMLTDLDSPSRGGHFAEVRVLSGALGDGALLQATRTRLRRVVRRRLP